MLQTNGDTTTFESNSLIFKLDYMYLLTSGKVLYDWFNEQQVVLVQWNENLIFSNVLGYITNKLLKWWPLLQPC